MKYTTLLVIGLLVIGGALAVETPKGIDGHIYALDGITPVPSRVDIVITNLDSLEEKHFHPGTGGEGRYSIVLPWPKDTPVSITATNPNHSVQRTVSLTGILHGVDLFLNMSLSPFPPEILSTPETIATEHTLYSYVVDVFDWNMDEIEYSVIGSSDMEFVDNTLYWTPVTYENVDVTIIASDGELEDTQQFTIYVVNVNDPPLLNNVLMEVDTLTGTFSLDAYDPDGDVLTYTMSSSSGLTVSERGIVSFGFARRRGELQGTITVSDGELSADALVTVKFVGHGRRKVFGGGGGGYVPPIPKKEKIEKPTGKLEKIPKEVPSLGKLTYSYFRVPASVISYDFIVENGWFEKHGINPKDVKLYSFRGGWKEHTISETSLLSGNVVLSAGVTPDTIFAIATNKLPEDLDIEAIEIKEPTVVVGILVDERGNPLPSGVVVTLTDKNTGEIYSSTTGTGPVENIFQVILDDVRNHEILVSIESPTYRGTTSFVANSLNDIHLVVKRRGLLTGLSIQKKEGGSLFALLIVILSLAGLYLHVRILTVRGKT